MKFILFTTDTKYYHTMILKHFESCSEEGFTVFPFFLFYSILEGE